VSILFDVLDVVPSTVEVALERGNCLGLGRSASSGKEAAFYVSMREKGEGKKGVKGRKERKEGGRLSNVLNFFR
jgi:hypothetical protein